jgi:hypothetical protein
MPGCPSCARGKAADEKRIRSQSGGTVEAGMVVPLSNRAEAATGAGTKKMIPPLRKSCSPGRLCVDKKAPARGRCRIESANYAR